MYTYILVEAYYYSPDHSANRHTRKIPTGSTQLKSWYIGAIQITRILCSFTDSDLLLAGWGHMQLSFLLKDTNA